MNQSENFTSTAGSNPDWLLLEDGPLIAVNKPVDLLTEGAPEPAPTMVREVKNWLKEKYAKPGRVYLGIPHRLDRATSGVLVFARNSKTAARLSEQFEQRQVRKTYLAVLDNAPQPEQGLLVDWLRKLPESSLAEVVTESDDGAKEARLEYRTLAVADGRALVEVNMLTGRMHQIRVQFASRGWAVTGDDKYGGSLWPTTSANGDPASRQRNDIQIALHARSLNLRHPIRYDALTIDAPLPPHWNVFGSLLSQCGEIKSSPL